MYIEKSLANKAKKSPDTFFSVVIILNQGTSREVEKAMGSETSLKNVQEIEDSQMFSCEIRGRDFHLLLQGEHLIDAVEDNQLQKMI